METKQQAYEVAKNGNFYPLNGNTYKVGDYFNISDFVLGEDGGLFVKHSALLRVTKDLFTISFYKATVVNNPTKENNWCCITQVNYLIHTSLNRALQEATYNWTSVADCRVDNSMRGFEQYTTTVSETRASARALRNILGVEFCSKEELASSEKKQIDNSPIEQAQKVLIETKFMGELNFTIEEMNEILEKKFDDVAKLTKSDAAFLIEKLNSKRKKKA